jgi:polyisoprenoid-binding protein YceI
MRHLKPSIALLVTAICAASVARAADSQSRAIDVAHSHMTVYVYKQGLFSFAADNHEIDAPIVAGSVDGSTGSVQLSVDATKLKVLDPKMSADKRDQVQSKMTGSDVLDVAKYPKIEFHSTKVATDGQHWNVTGDLTLHGQTHPIVIDVVSADASHFTGSVMVRQSDFGITPIRILGGTVTVKNDVKVEFAITLAAK